MNTVTFSANDIPSKNNLRLTIPDDVQQKFHDSIMHYRGKCCREIDYYLIECGEYFFKI